ncbi:3'-5' exonuclease [Actinocorallia libanotica]|uniref:Exonuclease domain-containing protein n=1 Tax=Actinocorallia libanotica TaxID=46162 RepID=A0ABN1Q3D5_9ACTN
MRGYAVVDVETTGFTPARGEIAEVAVVHVDEKGGVTGTWDTLVRPHGPMAGTNVHRITAAMVRSAPTFDEIAHELRDHLSDRVVVAHNLPFDARFLTAQLDRAGLPAPQISAGVCTLRLARRALRGPSFKLPDCCEELGIPLSGAHAALADTLATAALFQHLLTADGPPAGRLVPALPVPRPRLPVRRLSRA